MNSITVDYHQASLTSCRGLAIVFLRRTGILMSGTTGTVILGTNILWKRVFPNGF